MKYYDITKEISETMVVYKDRDSKRIKRLIGANYENNQYFESRMELDMHTGTHVDAPLHMIEGGETIEQLDWTRFIGDCKVFDLTHVVEFIAKKDLENLDIQKDDIVLFKTMNSYNSSYNPKFVYLEEDAAHHLVACGIRCLGMDAMSIERDKPGHPTHKIILSKKIGVIEDLSLKDVAAGTYFLSALPLHIKGAEASPVRAVLFENPQSK